ncbi:MAG: hypothetical protein HWE34_04325 [Methylocystaceae bacterium]|nr:hypothetical protein [Methylocystaceae bacterium]
MPKQTVTVDVVHTVKVTLDTDKLTQEFCDQFNETINYFGDADEDMNEVVEEHAKHLATLYSNGAIYDIPGSTQAKQFIEGYGPLGEMNISIEGEVTEINTTDFGLNTETTE